MAGIKLIDVSKIYDDGIAAIKDLNLKAENGKVTAVIGERKAGKSTLLCLIAGLEKPTAGSIIESGKDITFVTAQERDFGIIFKNEDFSSYATVSEVLNSASDKPSQSGAEFREKLIDVLSLRDFLGAKTKYLSEDTRLRLSVACAFIRGSTVLIDDPLEGQDVEKTSSYLTVIKGLATLTNKCVIIFSSSCYPLAKEVDSVALLDKGTILAQGSLNELFKFPGNIRVLEKLSNGEIKKEEGKLKWEKGVYSIRMTDGSETDFANREGEGELFNPGPDFDEPEVIVANVKNPTAFPLNKTYLFRKDNGREIDGLFPKKSFVRGKISDGTLVIGSFRQTLPPLLKSLANQDVEVGIPLDGIAFEGNDELGSLISIVEKENVLKMETSDGQVIFAKCFENKSKAGSKVSARIKFHRIFLFDSQGKVIIGPLPEKDVFRSYFSFYHELARRFSSSLYNEKIRERSATIVGEYDEKVKNLKNQYEKVRIGLSKGTPDGCLSELDVSLKRTFSGILGRKIDLKQGSKLVRDSADVFSESFLEDKYSSSYLEQVNNKSAIKAIRRELKKEEKSLKSSFIKDKKDFVKSKKALMSSTKANYKDARRKDQKDFELLQYQSNSLEQIISQLNALFDKSQISHKAGLAEGVDKARSAIDSYLRKNSITGNPSSLEEAKISGLKGLQEKFTKSFAKQERKFAKDIHRLSRKSLMIRTKSIFAEQKANESEDFAKYISQVEKGSQTYHDRIREHRNFRKSGSTEERLTLEDSLGIENDFYNQTLNRISRDLEKELKELDMSFAKELKDTRVRIDPIGELTFDLAAGLEKLYQEQHQALGQANKAYFFGIDKFLLLANELVSKKIVEGERELAFQDEFDLMVPHDSYKLSKGPGIDGLVLDILDYGDKVFYRVQFSDSYGNNRTCFISSINGLERGDRVSFYFDTDGIEIEDQTLGLRII